MIAYLHDNRPNFGETGALPEWAFALVEDLTHIEHPVYGSAGTCPGRQPVERMWRMFPTERGLTIECRRLGIDPADPPAWYEVKRADIAWGSL